MLRTLHKQRSSTSDAILRLIRSRAEYVFNPSIRKWQGKYIVAARTSSSAIAEVRASTFVIDAETMVVDEDATVDLSAIGEKLGISSVADPKLFEFQGSIWLTFNTGYVEHGNSVYVMTIYPEVGDPIRCDLAQRQLIEKNWAFFENESGQLGAIYSLAPLTILSFEKQRDDSGQYYYSAREDYYAANPVCNEMTIGTQPLVTENGLLLIAHQRIGHRKFRGYLGRPVRISQSNGRWLANPSRLRLIHSLSTLLGSRPRRNKHLWFATYFSGISRLDAEVVVSYGINDQKAGIARLSSEAFSA